MRNELKNKGIIGAKGLAVTSKEGILTENLFGSLDPLIEGYISDKDIEYIIVMDRMGKVIAHNNPKEVGKIYKDELTRKALTSKEPFVTSFETIIDIGSYVLKPAESVLGEAAELELEDEAQVIGAVRLGITTKILKTELNKILLIGILLTVGIVFIGFLFAFLFTRSFTKPINSLVEATVSIAGGKYHERVTVSSKDEVGTLAHAFNEMAENLEKSTTELQATNRELVEAQERLVRTERLAAIGELSRGVAHELRNPLGAIKNATYYIKKRLLGSDLLKDEPRVGEFLEIMDEEIETSDQVITDLMDFSRVNPPKLSHTKLEVVVDSALSRLEVKGDVKVVVEIDSSLPEVAVDAEQLRRAFGNLIKNADEAMPDGGTLTITANTVNGFVELKFHDTGQGISAADLPKVLYPLFTTKPKGVGLGLAIINSIIEKHQGSIEVNSKQGEGTTFTIKLPVSNQQEAQSSESEE